MKIYKNGQIKTVELILENPVLMLFGLSHYNFDSRNFKMALMFS